MKHNRIVRGLVWILVIAMVVICVILACPPVRAAECRLDGKPHITAPWQPDEADVIAMAQMLYGECRGCSTKQQRAACRSVLNRVDDARFPDTIIGVITQKCQFFGYSADNPVWDSLYEVAYQEIKDWHDGKPGVIGPEFCFFTGNGRINIFRTGYNSGDVWAEE